MNNNSIRFFCVFVGCMFLPFNLAADESGLLNYVGSSTIGKYMHAAARVYHRNSITVKTMMESSGGEKWVAHGHADIGGVARNVKKKYLDMGVVATLIGKDGMGVLVHASNPVRDLTMTQLRDVFAGKIRNWQQLGGGDFPVHIYLVSEGSATYSVFQHVVLHGGNYARHQTMSPDLAIIPKVGGDRGGIGVLSLALLAGSNVVHPLSVDGQKPSLDNSNYPITRPLYLTTNGSPKGAAKNFIDWTLSKRGQRLVKRYFIGVSQHPVKTNVNPLVQSAAVFVDAANKPATP